jgi:hypothetical protein
MRTSILKSIDEALERLQAARSVLAGIGNGAVRPAGKKRRPFSAEARKRMSEAQQKRWAEIREKSLK